MVSADVEPNWPSLDLLTTLDSPSLPYLIASTKISEIAQKLKTFINTCCDISLEFSGLTLFQIKNLLGSQASYQ